MKFGYFDDENKEYVINTPKTPYPWINYLGSKDFFGLISNTSGGYCFYKDARLRRITRYRYNNIPVDNDGRYFFINDNGDVWSPSYMPVKKELDFYQCRHGLGYTKIIGERKGIRVTQTAFVPVNKNCEVHNIAIENVGKVKKEIDLFSYVEFCLWDAYDDMTNFQRNFSTGEVEVDNSVIYHKTEYRERRNHYAFFSVNSSICGFDTDRESFLGPNNGLQKPKAVAEAVSSNSIASGWSPIASHHIKINLEPGEKKNLVFLIGYIENNNEEKWEAKGIINKKKAKELIEYLSTEEAVFAEFNRLKSNWKDLLSNFQINSQDEKLNRMVNIWNQYQCMVTFNMSRSASYFESGVGRGMGFRDSNQDLLGFVHQVGSRARERILDIAATQFEDGGCYHQYQPLTKKGNDAVGSGFNDDPLWLIIGAAAYIKETGDISILNEVTGFGTLFEHLKASFNHVINNLGPHGLPLIGRADWNDCLNLNCFSEIPGESFQTSANKEGRTAESVFIAGLFVFAGNQYKRLCDYLGKKDEARRADLHVNNMIDTTIKYGFDGEWFLRAYDYYGDKIGSAANEEGKIFIEPQGFCVMAGIGVKEGLAEKALNSVEKYLETPYGIVLNSPSFTKYYENLGEISTYPPGYKENGGIFCHNNPWIACAEAELGHGDRAFEIYRKIAPAYLEDISEIHRLEPYVYSQMVAGRDAANFGEAKNSWLTGTAAWNFITITQWILGIKPDYDGLTVDPCIPKAWNNYRVVRKFRDVEYDILIKNPSHISKGVKYILVDNIKIEANKLPLFDKGSKHEVQVIMG